jgi:glucose/arabinose dehydrogenase
MKNLHFQIALLSIAIVILSGCKANSQPQQQTDEAIWVREGFKLEIVQNEIEKPRFMQFDDEGTLYVSLPNSGKIKTCKDKDGDGYYETVTDFVSGHPTVHGMDWKNGWMWYTESGAIFKARDIDGDGRSDEKVTVIPEGELPKGGGHWWRPVLIHNNRIYTEIGCSGNITDESDTERMKIWSFALDGTDKQLFASGLRNTEKLVVRPGTNEIWGMDHGSDWFGRVMEKKAPGRNQPITNLNPPEEMNHYVKGGYYGHPFIVGSKIPRYEYMDREDIVELAEKTIPPQWNAGAHWAANAMTFYTGDHFPKTYKNDAFVTYHGSWNREERAGYCVTRVYFEDGHPWGEKKYVNFLGENRKLLGRPVDVVVAPDGSLLISDDWGNVIYRLSYNRDQ